MKEKGGGLSEEMVRLGEIPNGRIGRKFVEISRQFNRKYWKAKGRTQTINQRLFIRYNKESSRV
jgi:hypothetical protein